MKTKYVLLALLFVPLFFTQIFVVKKSFKITPFRDEIAKAETGRVAQKNPVQAITAPKIAKPTVNQEVLNPYEVEKYIISQAKADNVNLTVVKWIVSHESQWGQNLIGDDGESLGPWMISHTWHPEVGRQCSLNLQCSTAWSLAYLKSGHQNEWSTWRLRFKLYPKENPPK